MGTNYYARRILTEDEIRKTLEEVEMYLRGELEAIERFDFIADKIHLGKLSSGWQFHWMQNLDCYDCNLESIKKYLYRQDIIIYDEYGGIFTPDEFFQEIGPSLYRDENHIDCEDYHRMNPESLICRTQFASEDGLRFDTTEFS